jgi:F-box protein 9
MPKNPATLQGTYKLFGDNLISADVVKPATNYNIRGGKFKQKTPSSTTTFHLEFQIQEMRGRANWMLRWSSYSVFIKTRGESIRNPQIEGSGAVNATNFELNQSKFPPLYFSRVKSYTSRSENILK